MPIASRTAAIDHVTAHYDDGGFFTDLARRIAIPTSSQEPECRPALTAYLRDEMAPTLEGLGYTVSIHDNPVMADVPILMALRLEDPSLPTVFTYGHGDVIRGLEGKWDEDRDPWKLTIDGDRIYGRGTADNKGQHSINIAAIASVLATRGRLGFNSKILIETGEEVGSAGLAEFCTEHKDELAADMLLASDGPRLAPDGPTIFMGTRGAINFTLRSNLREGGHHSGNWGGLLANPGVIIAHAIASLIGPRGEILLPELKPKGLSNSVRAAIADCHMDAGPDAPAIDPDWGE
ncbi:MAG: M20/M25/M40 family metallo-hydrolase, partial [Alphaproteobacteria bacterium]